jgi:hypothetical protein
VKPGTPRLVGIGVAVFAIASAVFFNVLAYKRRYPPVLSKLEEARRLAEEKLPGAALVAIEADLVSEDGTADVKRGGVWYKFSLRFGSPCTITVSHGNGGLTVGTPSSGCETIPPAGFVPQCDPGVVLTRARALGHDGKTGMLHFEHVDGANRWRVRHRMSYAGGGVIVPDVCAEAP